MKRIPAIAGIVICAILASFYIYPIFSGLILLPLDLLVSNSGPWHYASTILLKNSYMQDSVLQMFAWRHLTFSSLTSGILPLWNPYQLMGMPFMAGMKPLIFYPANILYFFGEIRAWNMLLWLQLFLSLWFTYLFVISLGLSSEFALFAGIAYAFNSLMMSVLEFGSEGHVLLWLPILLYFVKRYLDTVKPLYIAGIAIAVASSIFAGQLQYFAYLAMVVCGFMLWYGISTKKPVKMMLFPAVGIALGGMIAAVQLLPSLFMFQESYRDLMGSYATFSGGLLKPYHLLRLLSPDWFGNPVTHDLHGGYIESSGYFGIIPLFFMLYAARYSWKNYYVRFFTLVAAIALLFSMDGIAQLLYVAHIPIITSGYGSRMFSMFLFSGAILSAFGFSAFIHEQSDDKRIRAVLYYLGLVGVLFIGGLGIARWNSTFGVHLSNVKIQIVGIAAFIVAALGFVKYQKHIPVLRVLFIIIVLVLTYGDLFRMGYRFLTFSNSKFLYPEVPLTKFIRTESATNLGREYGLTEPEVETALGVYGTETYNPLFSLRTGLLLQALEGKVGAPFTNNKYNLTQNPRMKSVLDFLGVDYIVVPQGEDPSTTLWNSSRYQTDLTKVYTSNGSDVFLNKTAYPRFGLYYQVLDNVSDANALRDISHQSLDFRNTVILKERLNSPIGVGSGSAQLTSSGLNIVSFRVTSTTPALFYLSDSYDAGWHASVNGHTTPIYHANYNFRAVLVPAGRSNIMFWYLPNSVIIGAAVSVTGLAGTFGYLAFAIFRSRRKPDNIRGR